MQRIAQLLALQGVKLTFYQKVWLVAPIALWFSYHPVMYLGKSGTMYFELSLALLYVVVLALAGLPNIVRGHRQLVRSRLVWLVTLGVLLGGCSLLWTPNLTRGVLTMGVMGLLYMVFLASLASLRQLRSILPALARLMVASAVLMSLIAAVQLIAGMWLAKDAALLCAGCVAEQFGFVRPNVFAIEPQFFGSLLIAPMVLLTYLQLKGRGGKWRTAALLIIAVALFLTLSRGAIFAGGVGVVLLFACYARELRRATITISLFILAFAASLTMQGIAAVFHPVIHETFGGATSKVVNHLSLGVIEIKRETPVEKSVKKEAAIEKAAPKYDGYVEESTEVRMNRSTIATETWRHGSLGERLFGVGLGGAGVAMHREFPTRIGAREIVQNEYVEVLLERGVVGLVVLTAIGVAVARRLWKLRWPVAVLVAYGLQWMFFSGYPNALHIYVALVAFIVAAAATAHRDQQSPARQS